MLRSIRIARQTRHLGVRHAAARHASFPVTALVAVAVAVAGMVGCSDTGDGSAATPADGASSSSTSTTAPDILDGPAPEEPGRYGVGRVTLDLVDPARAGRTLTTDVWYPIAPSPNAEPSLYEFDASIPPIDLHVAKAGVPIADDGPFPLVVFSHGSPSIRYQSLFLTELLASRGFVVAAPDHAGDSAVDALRGTLASPDQSALNRPADISFVIGALLDGADGVTPELTRSIDPDRVGIAGHSGGGETVLAVGADRPGSPSDERVRAVLAWTPATDRLSDAELASIDVPTMLYGATLDDVAPIAPNVERAWGSVVGRPLYRVDVVGAGHDQFTNVCDFLAAADADPAFPPALRPVVDVPAQDACTPDFIPIDEAHDLIARYSVAFLEAYVAGNSVSANWLTPRAAARTPAASFAVGDD